MNKTFLVLGWVIAFAGTLAPKESAALGDLGPDTCIDGLVWREACGPDDHVCVAPDVHRTAQADNATANQRRGAGDACKPGFEWREACGPQDRVCVESSSHYQAIDDNLHRLERLKYPVCKDYALEANAKQLANVVLQCHLSGPRWQEDFSSHFNWCLNSPPIAATSETKARRAGIKECIEAAESGHSARHVIDPTIYDGPAALPDDGRGPRPLAAMVDRDGVPSVFVSNEIIIRGASSDVTAFLAKYPGDIIGIIGPSTPPPKQPPAVVPPQLSPAGYVVRLRPQNIRVDDLDRNAEKFSLAGLTKFSSEAGAEISAVFLREAASGAKVALNFLRKPHNILRGTTEQADQAGVSDAFKWLEFYQVRRAWQFINQHGIVRKAKVAIIDSGFWLNNFGIPCAVSPDTNCGTGIPAVGASDLPIVIAQFNSIGSGGQFAGGASACGGAPWHGNGTASVATGSLNNGTGAAGSGGQVAIPILIKTNCLTDSVAAAVIDAIGFGADIINLSLGDACGFWCRLSNSVAVDDILDQALDGGVLVVASAGNNSIDATDNHVWPCQYSSSNGNGVYCVGALNSGPDGNGYSSGDDGTAAPYSNFGSTVNIWAQTNIHVMPPPAFGGATGILTGFAGTSASAPFVAGVAAMVKAINPSLGPNDIKNIIGNGPFIAGTSIYGFPFRDPIGLVIQPYEAVVAAAGGYHLSPELDVTSPTDGATIVVGDFGTAFHAAVADVNDGIWPLPSYSPNGPTPVSWRSDVDGPLASSDDTTGFIDLKDAPEGPRHITATVKNSAGEISSSTILITVKYPHTAPTPVITWPPNGITVAPGSYSVTGHAKSSNPGELGNLGCDSLKWDGNIPAVDVPNAPGECEAQVTFNPGVDQVSLTATGKYGDSGTATVSVNTSGSPGSLVVQIVAPRDQSVEVSTNGGSSIGLSGTAAPIQANSVASYSWRWFRTGADPSTQRTIGAGQNLIWNISGTGLCNVIPSTEDVTLELDVVDDVISNPALTTTGSARSNIHVDCQKLT